MASPIPALVFDHTFAPEIGVLEPIADAIARVTAPNASDYTFTGTNTYIIGDDPVFIVDIGPNDPAHLEALAVALRGRRVEAIVLTHTHKDHSGLARAAAERFAAPVWFAGQHRRSRPLKFLEIDSLSRACDWDLVPDRVLADQEELVLGTHSLKVITTPGHCANHVAFGIIGSPYLLAGDHVMGWNSTLVAVPDGSMKDYFASLEKLDALAFQTYLPGHGGPIKDGPAQARALSYHRAERNTQILELVEKKPRTIRALLDAIYPELPKANRIAARLTLAAHVEYLVDSGAVRQRLGLMGREVVLAQ